MPKVVDIEAKRGEILEAAVATFSRHGYRGTNLQRVAVAAGMGKSSIYHYFPTREALFDALVRRLLEHEADLFEEAGGGSGPPAERLRRLLDAVVGVFDEWTRAGPLLFDCLREERGRRALRRALRRVRSALVNLIRDGQEAGAFRRGDPQALATVVIGSLDGALLLEVLEPGTATSTRARRALRESLERTLLKENHE